MRNKKKMKSRFMLVREFWEAASVIYKSASVNTSVAVFLRKRELAWLHKNFEDLPTIKGRDVKIFNVQVHV
jgi:hypothetical protein